MNWITTIAAVLAFVIIGFILFIFMPKPTVFFDPYVPEIEIFKINHDEIVKEIDKLNNLSPIIPIFGDGIKYTEDYSLIYDLLRSLPYVRYAGIINLKPGFEQVKQYGYNKIANDTIRYFYTVKQSSNLKSGIWVDGAKKFFTEKEWICADVSRENSLFNKNKYDSTTVIFVDIDRPLNINLGNSPNTSIKQDEVLSVF